MEQVRDKAASPRFWHPSFVGVATMSMAINLLMLTGPLFMLQTYDRVLTSGSTATLITLFGLVAGLYFYFAILEGIRSRILTRLGRNFENQWAQKSFQSAIRLPLKAGAKAAGLNPIKDIERVRQFFSGAGPAAIFDMPWLPIYLAMVFLLHPVLGWLGICGTLVTVVLVFLQEKLTTEPIRDASQLEAQRENLASSARRNTESLVAMGMVQSVWQRWAEVSGKYLNTQTKVYDLGSMFTGLIKSWRLFLQSGVLAMSAYLAILGEVTPGVMIAASILVTRALAPVEQATANWRKFVAARHAMAQLERTLAATAPTQPQTMLPLPTQTLQCTKLAAAAPGTNDVLIKDVNFTLRAGDGLGIIGPSGSGKSSLARAVMGLWPLVHGELRLDGATFNQWEQERLGAALGYLPQEVDLLSGTIAQNIARFDPEMDDDAVLEAARLANVEGLIAKFEDGYDTQVGARGENLSSGQRQRIGLARALYKNPFLILLDEPNSNLDAEGEEALARAIRAARDKGSIVIVIAHRPSAIISVDQLLLLNDGKQVAFGPKDKILADLNAGEKQARTKKLQVVNND